ncbi:7,8-didemethyl-8-hydroxy-5-deazariboflavin synthase CofG [Subtercola vilae]|uniref:7,8-didemethyl-8-hydroxy-5-deazariboflavin synthase CofG n=1 Tax=Subtercola vilae TaxID=2056433 RepID=UPI001F22C847|nr:7,8-didemethyl-8-hydroxy-5-deazariboflavin synthase CofG [Subtercola vilae]
MTTLAPVETVPAAELVENALERAEHAEPTRTDAELLLHARGDQLDRLLSVAGRLRDRGLQTAGRPGVITYSRKVFIPLTHLCQDRCHYCIFVQSPGKLQKAGKAPYLEAHEILDIARQGAALGCKEALFTLGDRPENRWPVAREWLDAHGYESTLDYVAAMSLLVLQETGLLPHLNPGVMTFAELQRLKPAAPSMGMMLETTATRLWSEKGGAHYGSPDKDPAVRLRVIEEAGQLQIPFTTGVLFGIGESYAERVDALIALRASSARWGHVQEVIVQNFRAKESTAMMQTGDLDTEEYAAAVAVARLVLGPDARLQVPPNLTDATELSLLVRAGIDDWGGVSPLTPDHVNPERPWPEISELARLTAASGYTLRERLTAHPHFVRAGTPWINETVLPAVLALADEQGLALEGMRPVGGGAAVPVGGSELAGRAKLAGRELGLRPTESSASHPSTAPSPMAAVLARAEANPTGLSDGEYAVLLGATGDELEALAQLADGLRREAHGETLSFVVNRNIDSSLVRERARATATGGGLGLTDIDELVAEAVALGASEICMQGPVYPELGAHGYEDLARRVTAGRAGLHLHAFRPAEIADGAARAGLSLDDFVAALVDAGVGSVPGTGARILDDDIRATLSGGPGRDLTVARYLDVVTAAHRGGLRSTATMVYGHIETAAQLVGHLRTLARLHDETGGFTEFIAMPFVPASAPDAPPHLAARGPNTRKTRAVHAVSRLMLAGRIDHIQAAWTKLSPAERDAVLRGGADDLGGVLLDGTLNPAAGPEAGLELSRDEVERVGTALGRSVWQRTTLYGRAVAGAGVA